MDVTYEFVTIKEEETPRFDCGSPTLRFSLPVPVEIQFLPVRVLPLGRAPVRGVPARFRDGLQDALPVSTIRVRADAPVEPVSPSLRFHGSKQVGFIWTRVDGSGVGVPRVLCPATPSAHLYSDYLAPTLPPRSLPCGSTDLFHVRIVSLTILSRPTPTRVTPLNVW